MSFKQIYPYRVLPLKKIFINSDCSRACANVDEIKVLITYPNIQLICTHNQQAELRG